MTSKAPELTIAQILVWADAHHSCTGQWPTSHIGRVMARPDETWRRIDNALRLGLRGLSKGSSLARLLQEMRGVRNRLNLPWLSEARILAWADHHQQQTGEWPHVSTGPVAAAPPETWLNINTALRDGCRGLPGGSSLAKLLEQRRCVRNRHNLSRLTVYQILAWADAWYQRTGRWPTVRSGPIPDAPGEHWFGVSVALSHGLRGLPGGSSLHRILRERSTGPSD